MNTILPLNFPIHLICFLLMILWLIQRKRSETLWGESKMVLRGIE